MASFTFALPWILAHEGGWSFDLCDPGGATNKGITAAVAEKHGIDLAGLRDITDEQVAAIYEVDYWRFSGVEDQAVAIKLFDISVNMGTKTAIKLAQEVMCDLGVELVIDGVWGPNTQAAINASSPRVVMEGLCAAMADRYLAIVARRPESGKFLKGWLKRAEDVPWNG